MRNAGHTPTAASKDRVGDRHAVGLAVWSIISCGWRSTVWSDTHLNYMIDMALTAEFSLAASGVR
jgi:hypothetical protein